MSQTPTSDAARDAALIVLLADRYGWTPDCIDRLSMPLRAALVEHLTADKQPPEVEIRAIDDEIARLLNALKSRRAAARIDVPGA